MQFFTQLKVEMKKRLPYPFLKERLIKLNSITEIEIQTTFNTVLQYNQSQHLVIKKAINQSLRLIMTGSQGIRQWTIN